MGEETYGQRVQRLRRQRGLTQEQLANAAGVKYRTLQDIELDKSEHPQRRNILALNAYLDIEGDADQERQSWPEDVKTILDIIGAYLMTLTPEDRIRWVSRVLATGETNR